MKTVVLVFLLGCVCTLGCDSDVDEHKPPCSENVDSLKQKVEDLMDKITHVEAKLQDLAELQNKTQGSPKVAFTVALRQNGSGKTGPLDDPTRLKYQKIISNFGDCYCPDTGTFTASVKGLFYFRFQMFNNLESDPGSVLSLMKNDERVVDISGTDEYDTGSNAAVLPLEVGDMVYVQLHSGRQVYDDSNKNYNTFSGFLLFTDK